MLELLRKLLDFFDTRSKVELALLFFPMLFIAASETAGVALVLPVIQVFFFDGEGGQLFNLVDQYAPGLARPENAIWVIATFVCFFAVKNFLYVWFVYLMNRIFLSKAARFISRMFVLYLSRPLAFHLNRNSAEILRDLLTGSSQTFQAVRQAYMIVLDVLIMLAVIGLLVVIHPGLTLAATAMLLVIAAAFHGIMARVFCRWGENIRTVEGQLIKWVNQSLASIRDVKLQHAYDYLGNEVEGHSIRRALTISLAETAPQIPRQMFEVVIVISFLVVVVVLRTQGSTANEIIGIVGLFGMAAMRLIPSLARVLSNVANMHQRIAFVNSLHQDMIDGLKDADWAAYSGGPPLAFARDIRLVDVSYVYGAGNRRVLDGVDLSIGKGESVAFVGPSGAGKTTLVDIILGLLRPQSGRLLVDGKDVFESLEAWQKRLGYVPQSIYLLDDTMRRNIAFGVADGDIDHRRVSKVVEMAGLTEVVTNMPEGLDTVVGEFGTRLSGGQRQRVAIARALYRDPDLLVFDEATSALDNETEREIGRAIDTLAGDKTILIIAHRLSTVRNCDRLVFLKDGRIVAAGSYDDLVRGNEAFRRFAALEDLARRRDEPADPRETG